MSRRTPLALFSSIVGVFGLVWACGGDDSTTPIVDAGVDAPDTAIADTSPPFDIQLPDTSPVPDIDGGPMCDPAKAFDPPTLMAEINTTGTEASLRLSFDQLTAYFASSRPNGQGGLDLWTATRKKITDPFSAFTNVSVLNSPQVDTHPSITADGLTLIFESNRISPSASVLIGRRADTSSPFNPPDGVPSFGNFSVVTDPFVRSDGQILYIAAAPPNGDLDVFRAYKSGKTYVGTTNVGEVNSQAQEELPTVSPNDHLMYLASTRIDQGSKGGFDIWMSTRVSINLLYSSPAPITELNTADDDFPDYISPDGCTLYFHRSIFADGGPTKSIWVAHKSM
jgi:WD40-like Beta Propeller Repeat